MSGDSVGFGVAGDKVVNESTFGETLLHMAYRCETTAEW